MKLSMIIGTMELHKFPNIFIPLKNVYDSFTMLQNPREKDN